MMLSKLFLLSLIVLAEQAPVPLLHPVSPMPSFSVVSVRLSKPDEQGTNSGVNQDSYHAERTTMKDVLAYAFGMGYDQELDGGPSWMRNERFDINGKLDPEEAASIKSMSRDDREEKMRLMVQSLLKERFHLTYHFEAREMPVYRLQIAKGGLKCPRDTTSQPAIPDPSKPRFRWSAAPAPPPPPPGWHQPSPTEWKRMMGSLHMHTKGWPWWLIATSLSHQPELAGKPVIDDTGLEGGYECDLQWSQEGSEGTNQYFFQAIQDQMGLKMTPSRGQVEVLVVDSIDHPSEN
ncbi:TIGR03435 family protein [Terriglobus roseus]|uniref:Soil-associated protein, TIGR03435 family n=1 Tax=Terriglobus roseus TaxID=392734 RepID=A0A1G7LJF0_9BACT|nr:TIGR03435 family protein [Terriglobus roseus]SDF49605.1 soil-associated protein, TIGR03435 family [Terriglobus roseus]